MTHELEGLYLIPENYRESMRLYIEHGIRTDKFLTAVLTNNLSAAHTLADEISWKHIGDYITFLTRYAPPNCSGSRAKVEAWIEDAADRRALAAALGIAKGPKP